GNLFTWNWVPAEGRSGGILFDVRASEFDVVDVVLGEYILKVEVFHKTSQNMWNFLTVYVDAQPSGKEKFLAELLGGILNKPGGLGRWSTLFNSVIESLELVELDICNRMYTWSNDHADPLFPKLDKCLVNLDWAELFPLITVSALERGLSDHCPLIIDFGSIDRGGKPFKFELCWFFRDDLELIVRETYDP
ncbi:hypothetical protein BRADI_3g50905v3, partial [Brachypodium distachyon]